MSNTLRSKVIRLAASMPQGSKERRELLNVLHTAGALPKIPGVSTQRLQALINEARATTALHATDAYHGAKWTAKWRITAGDPELDAQGQPSFNIRDAAFVSAQGQMEPILMPLESFKPGEITAGIPNLVGPVVAQALGLAWITQASFGWYEGTDAARAWSATKVGDTFQTDSDEFYRMGVEEAARVIQGSHAVKVTVDIKARATWRVRDSSLRIAASFTA